MTAIKTPLSKIPTNPAAIQERRVLLRKREGRDFPFVFQQRFDPNTIGSHNCENLVGSIEFPLGIAGPITIKHQSLHQPVYVPLATTEGALVASVNRGMKALEESGGVQVTVKYSGMSRAPVFLCKDGETAAEFDAWLHDNQQKLWEVAQETSRHLKMLEMRTWIVGRHLYARFTADTDQAMGMNMITVALQHIIDTVIVPKWKSKVQLIALSSNLCTDKKENCINGVLGRGYWAQAEAIITPTVLQSVLKSSADAIHTVHIQKNLIGSSLAGSLSQNAHAANIVAALYLATGQDPAHIVEASQAKTTIEMDDHGLYVALTLPNMNLGVVGGGTGLPTAVEARAIIDKDLTATGLAAVTAASALAGELSLLAALSTHTLARAHKKLAQGKR